MRRSPASVTVAASVLVAVALVVLVAVPLLQLFKVTAEGGLAGITETLAAPGVARAIGNTLALAGAVTVLAVAGGTALALALRRPDLPGRGALRWGLLLPLLVPQFVLGYSWTQAYGRGGFTDDLIGVAWPTVAGPLGVTIVLAVNSIPVVALLVTAGLATRAEPDLVRAARASGATGWVTLRSVTLPLLRPSLAASAVLIFVVTLESFAIPQVMGASAGFDTITTKIYDELSLGADPQSFTRAVTLAVLLVVLAAVVVVPADAVLGPRLRVSRAAQPPGAAIDAGPSGRSRLIAATIAGYLMLTTVVPLVSLLAAAVTRGIGLPPTPGNWTLDHLRGVLTGRVGEALWHSLLLAALAACGLTILGVMIAGLERHRGGRLAGAAVTLTLVVPGSALAVGVLIAYGPWLGGTLSIILICYLAKLWAFGHRPIAGALDRLPPAELSAARVSGATLLTGMRTVLAPPLMPALLGAWLLVFVTALHEVTMSSLLYGPRSETLAVVVLNNQELGAVGPTAALSVLLTALVLVPTLLFALFVSRRRRALPLPGTGSDRQMATHAS